MSDKAEQVHIALIGYGRYYPDDRGHVADICSAHSPVENMWVCTRCRPHDGPHVGHWPDNPDRYIAWDHTGLLEDRHEP